MGADQKVDAGSDILERIAKAFERKTCACVGCLAEPINGLCGPHWRLVTPESRYAMHYNLNKVPPDPVVLREIAKIAAREGRRQEAKLLNETADRMLGHGKASDGRARPVSEGT